MAVTAALIGVGLLTLYMTVLSLSRGRVMGQRPPITRHLAPSEFWTNMLLWGGVSLGAMLWAPYFLQVEARWPVILGGAALAAFTASIASAGGFLRVYRRVRARLHRPRRILAQALTQLAQARGGSFDRPDNAVWVGTAEGLLGGRAVKVTVGAPRTDGAYDVSLHVEGDVRTRGRLTPEDLQGEAEHALLADEQTEALVTSLLRTSGAEELMFGIGVRMDVRLTPEEIDLWASGDALCEYWLTLLERLATLCDHHGPPQVNVASRPVDVSNCPYCKDEIREPDRGPCPGCGALLHAECWAEAGGCVVMGCAQVPRRRDRQWD